MRRLLVEFAARLVHRVREARAKRSLSSLFEWVHTRLAAEPAALPTELPNPDGRLLDDQLPTLHHLLEEIDQIARSLPEDAQPISQAARLLVERSIEECTKPVIDAARLTRDMQEVGELAEAMRQRLLLSPGARTTLPS